MKQFIAVTLCCLTVSASAQTIGSSSGFVPGNTITLGSSGSIGPSQTGLCLSTAGAVVGFCPDANLRAGFSNSAVHFEVGSGVSIGFDSTTTVSNSPDTAISRHATAGVIDFGTGAVGSTAGGWQAANATLLSLTAGTNADFLCLGTGGGILIQSTACTISSLRFKPDWKPYSGDALSKVSKLDVGTFHLQLAARNADPNASSLQAGLNAEDVARIAPECAIYENDMKTPKSYRQECVIALLVKAIQQLGHGKSTNTGQR